MIPVGQDDGVWADTVDALVGASSRREQRTSVFFWFDRKTYARVHASQMAAGVKGSFSWRPEFCK